MHRIWQALLLSFFLGLGVLWFVLPGSLNLHSWTTFTSLHWYDLIFILGLVVAWWLLGGLRNIYFVHMSGSNLSFLQGIQTYLMGLVASVITPAAGGNAVGTTWILTRFGVPIRHGVFISVLNLVFDMTFFSWATAVSCLYLFQHDTILPIKNLGVLIITFSIFLVVFSYVLIFRLGLLIDWARRLTQLRFLTRYEVRFGKFLDSLKLASRNLASAPWQMHLKFHSVSALMWLSRFALLAAIISAFNIANHPVEIMAFNAIAHTFAFSVPTPGASGYQEFVFSWLLKEPGNQQALASAIIFWRILSYYLYFLIGPIIGGLALARSQGPKTLFLESTKR